MKGEWISSPLLIFRGDEYYKCSACGDLQKLNVFDNYMRYCLKCGDYKRIVRRIIPSQNATKKW